MAPLRQPPANMGAAQESESPSGPHPSFIQVAKPFLFEKTIQDCFAAMGTDPLREDSNRLQGVAWIDNVRKALQLPVRTFNTACVYYHRFRLVHPENEYNYADAAAAALFTACKIEDTLKKSRDILCTAYNLKAPPSEQLSPDDPLFESHSRSIIGLERLMLESSGFDFRNRHPQKLLIKFMKFYGLSKQSKTTITAYSMSLDMYRTFAPLKQTTSAMAFACLELASRLLDDSTVQIKPEHYDDWSTTRADVMETMLDLLELYTHHRFSTTIGPEYPLERFLEIRIPLNQEADAKKLPRYAYWTKEKTPANGVTNGSKDSKHTSRNASVQKQQPLVNPLMAAPAHEVAGKRMERGRESTVRFMLDPEQAQAERDTVAKYFTVEMEEYEVEE
ncbi:hypothetical protein VTO42DRAFT_360 [Malbranchea cinnamomea]